MGNVPIPLSLNIYYNSWFSGDLMATMDSPEHLMVEEVGCHMTSLQSS